MKCSKCSEDVFEEVYCGHCDKQLHYACAGLKELGYRRMNQERKAIWRCPTCRHGASPAAPGAVDQPGGNPGSSDVSLADVMNEIRGLRNFMESELNSIKMKVAELSKKWENLDPRLCAIEERISTNEDSLAVLCNVPQDVSEAKERMDLLLKENNERDQFCRLNNVEISGVPLVKKENLYSILKSICTKINFDLQPSDVDTIHRVRRFISAVKNNDPPRPPAIIVRFTQRIRKDAVLAAARVHRNLFTTDIGFNGAATNVFLSHHLTPTNKLLLQQAKKFKKEHDFKYLWIQDCKILIRKSEHITSKIHYIQNERDLYKLK